ncbi:hypothetical protein LTR37_020484 [Vermiconidia calcicola]|uniref:Uncharacterized protein n=1 Tax=Vermiconidia calcicola TaxID=1690605 RepID=A0ACC3MD22_9PEZI|nr:hypothetical protein LTR37_020484 [Vermiconidia calcicola]
MADSTTNPSSGAADETQEQQITFNIKSSSDAKYVLTLPISNTVGDLKQKLSTVEYANLPPERQRLIYSGRVLKDHDTIGSCKIKDGNTVHLVRGAESNSRQNPANQGGAIATPPGAGQAASNVPSNIAAGTGASNLAAQLTGARYAGFHGLPGADMFGADGGMGAPPNPDQMLRMLEDPNFASQMNEAMNNPAVVDMLRNNPMIRNNPIARQAIDNPEFRRMMMNPDMIRMQMQMQRAMGGPGGAGGGENAFPMPGQTDTTPGEGAAAATGGEQQQQTNPAGSPPAGGAQAGNPFAALFPGAGAGGDANSQQQQQNPLAGLFGGSNQQGAGGQGGNQSNPLAQMTQQLMQNPQAMQLMMQMMNGLNNNPNSNTAGTEGGGAGAGANPFGGGAGGFNPFNMFGGGDFGGMGGQQQQQPQAPPDDRAPEDRYADQLRQLNDMGFYEFERNVQALRRSGGSVQGAVEFLLS